MYFDKTALRLINLKSKICCIEMEILSYEMNDLTTILLFVVMKTLANNDYTHVKRYCFTAHLIFPQPISCANNERTQSRVSDRFRTAEQRN